MPLSPETRSKALRRLVCLSTSHDEFDDEALTALCTRVSKLLNEREISGIAVYYKKNFCHIIEGDHDALSAILIRMEKSGLHYNISVVYDDTVDARLMDKWHLGSIVNSAHKAHCHSQQFDFSSASGKQIMSRMHSDLACASFLEAFIGKDNSAQH